MAPPKGRTAMRIVFVSALLAAAAALALPARAQVQVVGNGLAHDCFIQAQFAQDMRAGISVCDDALKAQAMSGPDRASTLINRAIMKARSGDLDGAMGDYGAALGTGAKVGEAYLNRSATLIGMKRYADAQKDADQAIQLGTSRLEVAYYNRGIANEQMGNVQAAYEDFKAAVRIRPEFAPAADELSHFRLKTGA
jgi:tetratricopeptide (TPR) repeat protein